MKNVFVYLCGGVMLGDQYTAATCSLRLLASHAPIENTHMHLM